MEASAAAPQPHGPPAAERDGHQAPLQPQPIIDNPSKQQDVGRSIESQEHQSSEKTDMNVSPSISSNQDHHREPKIIPEEPNHNKPASEVNSRKTTPEHSHPTLSASEEQNSPFKNLCQNDALKPATTLDGHHKEPYSMKAETGTPSEHLNKPVSNNVSSQQSHETAASHPTNPPTESQPSATAVLSEHQSHHTTDSVDDLIKPDDPHKDKLTSVHEELNPVAAQQDEIKSPLDQQHITTSTANNVNVQHPQHGLPRLPSEHPLVELPGERPPMDLTMQGSVKPFAEMLQSTTEKPQTFSTSPQQESENKQQVGATKECQVASVLEEAQQNSTEQSTAKESQILTLRPSQKATRAEIDTAAPFESVKAAVSLFGGKMDRKSQTRPPQAHSVEKRVIPESELLKAQDDLVNYKDQLALTQASTAGVLLELKKAKRLIQNPANKLEGTDILSDKSLVAASTWKNTGTASPDKSNNELMTILREVESVKEELLSVMVSKDGAVKGLQDALFSLNSVLKRVDELATEKKSLDEAVADAHVALADAEEQVALLKSGQKVESLNSMPSDFMERKSAEIRGLELKLEEAKSMITTLKDELLVSKKAESLAVAAASETQQKVAKVKLELDQAKSEELSMVGKLATVLEECDELKAKLERTMQENTTVSLTIEALKVNIERDRKEYESMHEREQIACATLASLQDELQKLKEALKSVKGSEARALEAKHTLPAAIKQAASEADQAKAAAERSKEEARKAKQEIEQAKAATSTATSRQQAASKELEAARASEAMALAELKALTESESQSAEMELPESDGVLGVSISLEEYSALKQAAVEAESLADKKVAEVVAQVEDAKANQEKAQLKLGEAAKEAENSREELSKIQKQADEAQEAKLTAEGELRKWRAEHDLRRKSGGAPDVKAVAVRNPPRKDSGDEKLAKFGSSYEKEDTVPQDNKTANRDSLAQVMRLEVPTPERLERVMAVEDPTRDKVKGKKRNLIRRLTSIVALKKKP